MIPIRDELPTTRKPFVTVGLIVINCVVFLWQIVQPAPVQENIVFTFGAVPAQLMADFQQLPQFPAHWFTLISSMFLHGGFLHLAGNMLYLWIFGNNVEDYLGHFRFTLFYFACGIVAALTHAVSDVLSTVPMIGASGAISGVLGAYLLLYPKARVVLLIWFFFFLRFVRVPAFVVLGFWFVMQLSGILSSPINQAGGVALWAHVGGFIFGFAVVRLLGGPRRPKPYFA
ncbi:MAG TPA: rhomboid family intramembrane serine protease [bacterium]|jgi:membrane associated rhomboid family serine protease